MARRKLTYAEIMLAGNPGKLSKAQIEARRLETEGPGVGKRPSGLTFPERRTFAALEAELGDRLVRSDAGAFLEAVKLRTAMPGLKKRAKADKSIATELRAAEARLAELLDPIERRTPRKAPIPAPDAISTVTSADNCASRARSYAQKLVDGTQVAGRLAIAAARRFLDDLEHGAERGFRFDEAAAQKPADFLARLGLGTILDWEYFVIAAIFGFIREDGSRRTRTCYIEVAKKNGKSTLLAGLALFLASPASVGGDGEERPEVYCAATSKYQSQSICFKEAIRLRQNDSEVCAVSSPWRLSITWPTTFGKFEPLAANSEKLNGLNGHGIILDELADHSTSDLYNVLSTSTIARLQPLVIAITTAGQVREGQVAWEQRQHSLQVLERVIEDDSFFTFICTLDDDDRWDDEAVWVKANPSLGHTVRLENLREAAARCATVPSAKNSFLRYHLDIWPTTTEQGYINVDDLLKKGNAYLTDDEKDWSPRQRIERACTRLAKRECFAGLDLALKNDLSALALVFPPVQADGIFEVLFKVWCPEENIVERSKTHRVPYRAWADSGYITATPGDVTDFSFIKRDILALREMFRIKELGYDIHLAEDLALSLRDAGLAVTTVRQGFALSPTIQRVELLLSSAKLCMFSNPVANWCFSNAVLNPGVVDVRFDKRKSREKIDCAVAVCNALDRFLVQPKPAKPKLFFM